MKASSSLFGALVVALFATTATAAPAKYEIDNGHSQVLFRIRHVGVSNFYGQFLKMSGTFSFDEANPAASSVSLKVETDSVFTADRQRDKHLRSPDFFNAKQFPTIAFRSTKVRQLRGESYEIVGDMTMHGQTHEVVLKLDKVGEADLGPRFGHRIGFEGVFSFKRTDFGMDFSTEMIGDEVRVIVSVEGVRQDGDKAASAKRGAKSDN